MRCLLLIALLGLASSGQAKWRGSFLPGLFGNLEEATPTTVTRHQGYEERTYPELKWVCTNRLPSDDRNRGSSMFRRLYKYIKGQNSRNESIAMASPVANEVSLGAEGNSYLMCFYLGKDHQASPPSPTDPLVSIETRPQITVFTRTVGGYMRGEWGWLQEADSLAQILSADGNIVSTNHMFWVGYDAPFKFWNRRNEVWFVKG